MTTHERELTEPVDLCTPDGASVEPDARGAGRAGRCTARTCDGCVRDEQAVGLLGGARRRPRRVGGVLRHRPPRPGRRVVGRPRRPARPAGTRSWPRPTARSRCPSIPAPRRCIVDRDGLDLRSSTTSTGTRLARDVDRARRSRRPARRHRRRFPPDHESLNVVIPWSDELFNFTSKHQARPARGRARRRRPALGDRRRGPETRGACSTSAAAAGRREIRWNWGGGAGRGGDARRRPAVRREVDRGHGLHRERRHRRRPAHASSATSCVGTTTGTTPMQPWRVVDPGGQLDVVLTPRFDKHTKVDGGPDLGSETHQVFGTWSGRLRHRRRARARVRRPARFRRGGAPALVRSADRRRGSFSSREQHTTNA